MPTRGLVHRHVQPANFRLEARGDERPACLLGPETTSELLVATGGRVKILDFGLARAAADTEQQIQQGTVVGTPPSLSPEQAGSQAVHARSDLFSPSTRWVPFPGPGPVELPGKARPDSEETKPLKGVPTDKK